MIRLTRAQVREIDRRAIEEYNIPGIVLMENAAREAALLAHEVIQKPENGVTIFCGAGNNGGDGLAVARHLSNLGHSVSIHLLRLPDEFRGDALLNWRITRAMNIPAIMCGPGGIEQSGHDLHIDALFGTGLSRPLDDDAAEIVEAINLAKVPVLSIDVPSGLDCDTGKPLGEHCVFAKYTVTFVAEKAGFANPESKQYTGEVIVGDIGCPRGLIEEVARSIT